MRPPCNFLILRSATHWNLNLRVVLILLLVAACTPLRNNPAKGNPTETVTNSSPYRASDNPGTHVSQSAIPTSTSTECIEPETNPEATAPSVLASLTPIPTERSSQSTETPAAPTPIPCPPDLCTYSSQYFLARPIAPPGNDSIDVTYRFGSTQGGRRDPHHGVEFLNGSGTPVLAVADGMVVVAGEDRQPTSPHGVWPITFYGPYSYFYGNLVVIEHQVPEALLRSFPDLRQPIYTLYGHLSQISAQVGQPVIAGQEIGKVGMTGIAEGSHLHFEVRLGQNSYQASRNPELWLKPHLDKNGQPLGGIAGRLIDSYGNSLQLSSIVLEHLPEGQDKPGDLQVTLMSYEEKLLIGQFPWEESFGIGDLPPGWYRITYPYLGLQQRVVEVFPGQLTLVTLR